MLSDKSNLTVYSPLLKGLLIYSHNDDYQKFTVVNYIDLHITNIYYGCILLLNSNVLQQMSNKFVYIPYTLYKYK